MIRWNAELYIGKHRTPDAIYSSIYKDQAISGIHSYIATMVELEEPFKIIVKPINIKDK